MILSSLIKRTALHACSYRRLLVWHLFAYLLYPSCTTPIKHGVRESKDGCVEQDERVKSENGDSAYITTLVEGMIKKDLDATNESFFSKILCPFKSNYLKKIYRILLEYKSFIQTNRSTNGNNLFHILIEKIDLKRIDLLLIDQKKEYTCNQRRIHFHLSKLLDLRNNQGLIPFGLAIKIYGEKKLNHKAERRLEQIINKLLDQLREVWSYETTNGNNELHTIVKLHNKHSLSKKQKEFLEKVARQLLSMDPKPHPTNDSNRSLVNETNHRDETPLDIAVTLTNQTLFMILVPYTNYENRSSAYDLAKSNLGPTHNMTEILYNWTLKKMKIHPKKFRIR